VTAEVNQPYAIGFSNFLGQLTVTSVTYMQYCSFDLFLDKLHEKYEVARLAPKFFVA